MRALAFAPALGLAFLAAAVPAQARLWKPTPEQLALDYLTITHNKGAEGRVMLGWMASPMISAATVKPLLDKYVVLSIVHTRQTPGEPVTWDDIHGVQVADGNGQALNGSFHPRLVGALAYIAK